MAEGAIAIIQAAVNQLLKPSPDEIITVAELFSPLDPRRLQLINLLTDLQIQPQILAQVARDYDAKKKAS